MGPHSHTYGYYKHSFVVQTRQLDFSFRRKTWLLGLCFTIDQYSVWWRVGKRCWENISWTLWCRRLKSECPTTKSFSGRVPNGGIKYWPLKMIISMINLNLKFQWSEGSETKLPKSFWGSAYPPLDICCYANTVVHCPANWVFAGID